MLSNGHVLRGSGSYTIIKPIGSGGWGTVYLAENTLLRLKVAVKSLKRRPDLDDYEQISQRFEQEAHFGAGLNHTNIIRVYELIKDDYDLYFVMEYAEKGTLADWLKTVGSLPVGKALDISIAICQALDYAHRHNIVHGDVRPSNILLVVDRDVMGEHIVYKLSDFGFALDIRQENLREAEEADDLRPLGAWPYTSPERLKREPFDGRADIYSLGAILCEMLTGSPPFPLKSRFKDAVDEVIRCHLAEPVTPPRRKRSGLCANINQIVLKMLEKKPANRYESAAQLLGVLQTAREAQKEWEKELAERYQEANRLFGEENWQQAVERFEELLADNAPYDDLQHRFDEARKQVELAVIFEEALRLMGQKSWKEAIQEWNKILSQDKGYRDGEAKRQRDEAEAQIDLAEKYQHALELERRKQWEQAIQLFSAILAIRPGYKDASDRLAQAEKKRRTQVNYEGGIQFLNAQEWDKAIASLEAVLRDDPLYKDAASKLQTAKRWKKLEPLYERAMVHYRHKEWDKAVKLLEEVVAGDVGFRDAAQRLHQAKLIKEGKLKESNADPVVKRTEVESDHRGRNSVLITILTVIIGILLTQLIDATLEPLQLGMKVILIVGLLFVVVPAYILFTRDKQQ